MSRFIRLALHASLALALTTGLSACQTATEKLEKRLKLGEPVIRVYPAKYEEVETALKQAMMKYPQRIDNTEAGILETDYVKGDTRFKSPYETTEYSSGYRYRIIIRLVRGNSEKTPAVKVIVIKQIELARDFFSEPQQLPSDGIEESVILYRIGRELVLNRATQRAAEKAGRQVD